ncbi:Gamma-glutamyltranspeptidase @ Glutathione hydrolase [hydrothermal vent metagenome]|uniref:Gamma-glutamyltranspeptidase @ Glutathione hydrolase n=1 Tax=hydrothermal vent metagenome TaxID=652676 RepID=A0A3B1CUA0_9ZZZZ
MILNKGLFKPLLNFLIQIIPVFVLPALLSAQENPIISGRDRFSPIVAENGMVATQQAYGTKAGLQVLKEGGNAIDAAVTIGFTLAVTLPRAGNLGGGGFMLIYLADEKKVIAIDYREKAPQKATKDMFLDQSGNADPHLSRHSLLSVGVPGTVKGLTMALEKYGTISLKRALAPAIKLAEKGFIVDRSFSHSLKAVKPAMKLSPASLAIFYKKDGGDYQPGDRFVQNDLASTLKILSKEGPKAFYEGPIAEEMATFMSEKGGLITLEDMAVYRARLRKPIHGIYRGFDIYAMPPPSSGGIHIVQILNLLEAFPIRVLGHNTAETIHLMVESMKLAYADRSQYLGDSDFVSVPVKGLISKKYADLLRAMIDRKKARPSQEIRPNNPLPYESHETTHFSVMDQYGNAVSNTTTLNFSYGNKIVLPGTGILLNNQMDDFSAKSGVPNAYGLIGGTANAILAEKRMLSSMSPTIVMKSGKPFLATGSPGGSRIITTTLQMIINVIDHQMNIAEATNAVRIHHQWFPDELRIEEGLNQDTIRLLENKGHRIITKNAMGSAQSIMQVGRALHGASDPRTAGGLTAGH